jgi:hypothetical protein
MTWDRWLGLLHLLFLSLTKHARVLGNRGSLAFTQGRRREGEGAAVAFGILRRRRLCPATKNLGAGHGSAAGFYKADVAPSSSLRRIK